MLVVLALASGWVGVALSTVLLVALGVHHLLLVHLLHLHLRGLSNEHLPWLLAVELQALDLGLHGNWSWAQVLVWVEATEGSHLSEASHSLYLP